MTASDVQVGAAVRGFTWRNTAELAHWARGRGMTIVPANFCGRRFSSGTETLHYKIRPSRWAIARIWAFQIHETGGTGGEVDIAIGSGPTLTRTIATTTWLGASPILYFEDLSAKVNAVTDTTVTFTWTRGTIQIDSVTAFEVPRFSLDEDATEYGVNLESLFPQDVIYDAGNVSQHAVAELVDNLNPRRIYVANYFNTWSTSSATYQDVFVVPIPLLGQKLTSASTETVTWDVYARLTAAGDGDIKITTASSNSASINITNTSLAWVGTSTVSANVEDPTEDDGLPSSTWETVQLAGRVNSGVGDIEIRGFTAWRDS